MRELAKVIGMRSSYGVMRFGGFEGHKFPTYRSFGDFLVRQGFLREEGREFVLAYTLPTPAPPQAPSTKTVGWHPAQLRP